MRPVLIDCTFDRLRNLTCPKQIIKAHAPSLGYAGYLDKKMEVIILKQLNGKEETLQHPVRYHFFNGKKNTVKIFFNRLQYIKKNHPEILFIQGFIFPLEVIFLRIFLNKHILFIAQHHGGIPCKGFKKLFQRVADRCIQAYLFTSSDNAKSWINQKVISGYQKCYEVLEGSTNFKRQDKACSKSRLGLTGDYNFLWVGRLNANKDPITVLAAFEDYLLINPEAKLYMIYNETDLLQEVKQAINSSSLLIESVFLIGEVVHEELQIGIAQPIFIFQQVITKGVVMR